MSIAIIDAREWQRVFDLETGHKLDISSPEIEMVKSILAGHPFPGDMEMASNAWVTDTSVELIKRYQPQFAFITYSLPYFTFRFNETGLEERKRIIDSVFTEVSRFAKLTGFEPVIVGSGNLVPLKGYVDLSHLDGMAIATNWSAIYAGIYKPSARDLAYIADIPQVKKVAAKEELLALFKGKPEEAEKLPDYFIVAEEGYTYKVTGMTLRKAVNIPAHNFYIPIATGSGQVEDTIEVRSLIEKELPNKKMALIVVEGLGEEDFPIPVRRVKNGLDWYCYEQGDLQFFALNMGRHNFMAYPQGSTYYEAENETKPYPFSGYFYDIATDTIGSKMGIRRIAVGSRSMITHATTGADICIECFARNLANQGCMAVINTGH